jgi:hypothetical protein
MRVLPGIGVQSTAPLWGNYTGVIAKYISIIYFLFKRGALDTVRNDLSYYPWSTALIRSQYPKWIGY